MDRSRQRHGLLIALAVVVTVTIAIALLLLSQLQKSREEAAYLSARELVGLAVGLGDLELDILQTERLLASVRLDTAVSAARLAIETRLSELTVHPQAALRRSFIRLVEVGDLGAASQVLAVWRPGRDDPAGIAAWIGYQIQTADLSAAREAAWEAAEQFEQERSSFIRLWYRYLSGSPGRPSIIEIIGNTSVTERYRSLVIFQPKAQLIKIDCLQSQN